MAIELSIVGVSKTALYEIPKTATDWSAYKLQKSIMKAILKFFKSAVVEVRNEWNALDSNRIKDLSWRLRYQQKSRSERNPWRF